MSRKLMGRKRGMTRFFDDKGNAVVVTVVEAEPNVIAQIKTEEKDGYAAIQCGFEKIVTKDPRTVAKRISKPVRIHYEKAGLEPHRFLCESRIENPEQYTVGDKIEVSMFQKGDYVDVTATTKGKGFQGEMKRFNFAGGRATHGNSRSHRVHGSTGMRSSPGRCLPNQKRASHMGMVDRTIQNLEVIDVKPEENVILIKGAIPGPRDGLVYMKDAAKKCKKK